MLPFVRDAFETATTDNKITAIVAETDLFKFTYVTE